MANKRKKKQKEQDFKKTNLKVGKSLPKGANETDTSFSLKKISIPLQDVMKEKNLTNVQNKDLKDLLANIQHYKASVRKEALLGLKLLFEQHQSELQENLNKTLTCTIPLMHDLDSDVRLALITVLDFILAKTAPNELEPYFLLLVNHLNCAMTHINEDVQLSSLKFLDLLLRYAPENMKANYSVVLDNLLGLIVSSKKDSQSKAKVTVAAAGKFASQSSKNKVLQQIFHVLDILYSEDTQDKVVLQNHPAMTFPSDTSSHFAVFDNSSQLPSLSRFHFSVNLANVDVSTMISLRSLMEKMIPALIQLWIECLPSSTSQQNGSLSSESLSILVAIAGIIKLLFNATKNNTLVKNWLVTTYEREFKKHILTSFPYQGKVVTTKKKSSMSESSQVEMLLTLDITICEVMAIFLDENMTTQQVPWMKAVEDFIVDVLNSQAVNLKVEHLEGICRYTRQLVTTRQYYMNNHSIVQLLESLLKLYERSHLLSSIKARLLLFFGEIYEAVYSYNTSNQGIPESLQTILNNWRNSIPSLLVQCSTQEGTNKEFVKMIISLLSKLTVRFSKSGHNQNVEPQLIAFIDDGSLSTMSHATQKAVVDLFCSLPEIEDFLLYSLVTYCHRIDVPAQIVQDIIIMIYQRSQACHVFTDYKCISLSSCHSCLFNIAVGYSTEELSIFQDSEQSMFTIHEGVVNTTRKALQRQDYIIMVLVNIYKSECYGPYNLKKHLLQALDDMLNRYKTFPLSVASSILSIYKCYCDLFTKVELQNQRYKAPSLSSLKPVANGISKLSMASLEYAAEDGSNDVKMHLFSDVVNVVKTCPVVAKELLQILADRIRENKAFSILCQLIESLSQNSLLSLSHEIEDVLRDLMAKVESYYPENASYKAHCQFLLHK